jgi:hypothetical protein
LKKTVPQRLKPRGTSSSRGTAKAVPFLQGLFPAACKAHCFCSAMYGLKPVPFIHRVFPHPV